MYTCPVDQSKPALHDLLETDPRAGSLPPAVAYVWIRLGRLIARLGGLDTLRFGAGVESVTDLAVWLRMSVTEVDSALRLLVSMGALVAIEGGYQLPDWTGVASR